MQVLIESRPNSLKLVESAKPRKGCLGRIEGVCADFLNPTRNGRLYTRKLWENVFSTDLFKESLESKTLIGELDHPEERFEPLAQEACIVMTDYRFDDDNGVVYAGFDILDTPKGKILKALLDYGCVMGVSSRGQGDIVNGADGEMVDESSYDFACFDVVTTPAVAKARQSVIESVKRTSNQSLSESFKAQIEDAETATDLNVIRSVIRTSNLSSNVVDSLMESIEHKCTALQDSTTVCGNSTESETITESATTNANSNSAKTIRDVRKYIRTISEQRKSINAYKHREDRFVESIVSRDETIGKLNDEVAVLEKQVRQLKAKLNKSVADVRTANESLKTSQKKSSRQITSVSSDLREARQTVNKLTAELESLRKSLATEKHSKTELSESLKNSNGTISRLNRECDELKRSIRMLESQNSKNMSDADTEAVEYSRLLSEAEENVRKYRDEATQLQTVVESSNRQISTLQQNIKELQKHYIRTKSSSVGVDAKLVESMVKPNSTASQIDSIIKESRDKLDRYNKLPFASNTEVAGTQVLSENIQQATANEDIALYNLCKSVH